MEGAIEVGRVHRKVVPPCRGNNDALIVRLVDCLVLMAPRENDGVV